MMTYGAASAQATGSVSDEAHTVNAVGEFIPTNFLPSAITSVEVGATAMVEGVDYEARPSGIVILAGAIEPADVVLITYTRAAADIVEAMTGAGKEYELMFDGLNEARSGKRTRVRAWRVKPGVLAQLALLGEEYAGAEVTAELLADPTKVGANISRFFKVEIER